MTQKVTLALDAMSGDHGHEVVVQAALNALRDHPAIHLLLVGDESLLASALSSVSPQLKSRISIRHATQVVEMDEPPSKALRGKRDSSMRVAINLVKTGDAQACVSAGNTGALMAMSRFVLKTLPGIDRPAIISAIPSHKGYTFMLDLGANAECSPEQLFQFAVMGSVVVSEMEGIARPKVALLNIGEEEIKGNEAIQTASKMLELSGLNYIGFVEGDGVYLGDVDVVVCDGFVGNIALKTSEGVAKLIGEFIKAEFSRSLITKLSALAAMPVLKALKNKMDPRNYNGASLVGLNGIVIKSHGGADVLAFGNAINIAVAEVEKSVPEKISHLLEHALAQAG